jgi:putative transposase
MLKTFAYRLYPTKRQETILSQQLEESRWLYNHFLGERKQTWEERQESTALFDQTNELPSLKGIRPTLKQVHSQVAQNAAVRVDLAMQAFFRRVKAGETPGYPRFKSYGRYNSMTFPQVPSGCALTADHRRVVVSKVGDIKIVYHRPMEGTPKTATLRRSSTGKWYITFACEWQPMALPPVHQDVGIDVGLKTFATCSNGKTIENPRFFRAEEKVLATAHRKLSKEEKGTPQRKKRRKVVARVYERVAWRRENFAHQHSRAIVNHYDFIAVEDLSINRMVHDHCLARSIHDAAWGQFAEVIRIKAEWAGRAYIAVNPAYTSQNCSSCGHRKSDLSLADRIYHCECCGITLDRDLNAALNIVAVGQHGVASA